MNGWMNGLTLACLSEHITAYCLSRLSSIDDVGDMRDFGAPDWMLALAVIKTILFIG